MNTLRNKVSLIGRAGKNPEMNLAATAKGRSLAKFTLATKEDYIDKNGKWIEHTQWHNLFAWGKTAENITKLITKGKEVMIEGRIVNRMYEKDGEKKYFTEIEILDFLLVAAKNKEMVNEETEQLQSN